MKRPFNIRYFSGTVSKEMHCKALLGTPIVDDAERLCLISIQDFLSLGLRGGLAGNQIPPALSGFHIVNQGVTDNMLFFTLGEVNIDMQSIFILENIFHFIHDELFKINEVQIWWDAIPSSEYEVSDKFPTLFEPVSFELSMEFTRTEIDIDIELTSNHSKQILEDLDNSIFDWFSAGNVGAFGDEDIPPNRAELILADRPYVTDNSILFSLDSALCNDAAFDCLINILHKFHHQKAAIEKITIG